MMGDLQTGGEGRRQAHRLRSEEGTPMDARWVSIPSGVWPQVVVPDRDWVVVSFHTVPAHEMIEERPDTADAGKTRQRKYIG